jgi:hypothetical protein
MLKFLDGSKFATEHIDLGETLLAIASVVNELSNYFEKSVAREFFNINFA